MHSPKKAEVVNVVAKIEFSHRLDPVELSSALDAELKRYGNNGSLKVVRVRMGTASILIYSTGKAICIGARSEREARLAIKKLVKIMKKRGFLIKEGDTGFEVLNVVASVDLGHPIDVLSLSERLERCLYEPEIFPGLIVSDRWTYLIFGNGKANVLGLRSEGELDQALARLSEILSSSAKTLPSSEEAATHTSE